MDLPESLSLTLLKMVSKYNKGRTIRLQGGGAGSFCKKKNLTHSKVKKKKLDPHIEGKKKNLTHMGRKKKTCPGQVKKKLTHT